MSRSRVVAVIAFLGAAALFVVPWLSPGDYECSECSVDADCTAPLKCLPFDDGKTRCVDDKYRCTVGHIDTGGTPLHMAAVALLVVGALALSWHRLKESIGTG